MWNIAAILVTLSLSFTVQSLLIPQRCRRININTVFHANLPSASCTGKPKPFFLNSRESAARCLKLSNSNESLTAAASSATDVGVQSSTIMQSPSLSRSMFIFFQYLFHQITKKNWKKRIISKRRKLVRKKDKKEGTKSSASKSSTKPSILDTISFLNTSRRSLIELVGYDASLLFPAFTALLMGSFFESCIPHYYSQCITCIVGSSDIAVETVVKALVGLATMSVFKAIFTGARGSLFWIAGSRGNFNIRCKLHRNLLLQESAFFDSTETGVLLSRLNNDVQKIGMIISFHVNIVLRQFAKFLFGAAYLISISPKLAGIAGLGISVVAWISFVYGEFSRHLAEKVQDELADSSAVAETSFTMSETVRAFNGVDVESDKYQLSQAKVLQLEEVQAWAYGMHKIVSDSLETVLQGILLFTCYVYGRRGGLPGATLTTFLFYVNFVLESSNEVGDQWAKIQSAIGASSNVFDLIRRVPKVRDNNYLIDDADDDDITTKTTNYSPPQPIITMANMTVTYAKLNVPALKNIDLNIYPGDRVAIVGRSGSGKSSMLRTILRFYDPSSGSCNFEGTSLTKLSRQQISNKITIVAQEPQVFPMTLIENVLYGIPKDAIHPDTKTQCFSDFYTNAAREALALSGLPVAGGGNLLGITLDTRIGEGGRTLSGGQRQRVAIARALVRDPHVLLLDEPTAALDSQSEKTVVEALKSAMQKTQSMVMVTHRLNVIRSLNVNKVIVLDGGEIAEFGDPELLLNKPGGIYAQLAREQGIQSTEFANNFVSDMRKHDDDVNTLVANGGATAI